MSYAFVLTDLRGRIISELDGATSKRIAIPMRAAASSLVTVKNGSREGEVLLEGDALLRVYDVDDTFTVDRDRTLLGHHRLTIAEEQGAAASVAATFADPMWVWARRHIGKSATGFAMGGPLLQDRVDPSAVIVAAAAAVNAEGPTGLRTGNVVPSPEASRTYVSGWYFKPLAEAVTELAAPIDGPDWRVRPIALTDDGYYGELDLAPSLSTVRPSAALEYGDGRHNVRDYRRAVTLEGTANRVYSLPAGFPESAVAVAPTTEIPNPPAPLPILTLDDPASIAQREILEAVWSSEITVDSLRSDFLRALLRARSGPRQTLTIDPVTDLAREPGVPPRVPRIGREINVGDIVPFRATGFRNVGGESFPVKRVNILARLHGWDVTVGTDGAATPTFTITPTAA